MVCLRKEIMEQEIIEINNSLKEKYGLLFENVKKSRLTKDEKKKLQNVKRVINKELTNKKGAKRLGVTARQLRNLKRQIYNEGDQGIIHKNRFYEPVNKFSPELREMVITRYKHEFKGKSFLSYAKVLKKEGVTTSISTIYNILAEARIKAPYRKK